LNACPHRRDGHSERNIAEFRQEMKDEDTMSWRD
jgi:hypothetical protein